MNTHQAKVLIHVDPSAKSDPPATVREMLGTIAGVTRIRPSAQPNLTWVDYDPGVIPGRAIVGHMRGHGLRARLIGM